MTRTEELLALAEKATPGPWVWPNVGSGDFVIAGEDRLAIGFLDSPRTAKYVAACNPETSKQLVELCRLQHVALIELSPCPYKECQQVQKETQDHAIAAFNKFEGGE